MPGKEADFPSRKQRKAAGKNGVMGRAAGGGNALPLYERSRSEESRGEANGKADAGGVSHGYVRDLE